MPKLGFDSLHGLLGEFDPGLIHGGHEFDQGMVALEGSWCWHDFHHGIERIEQGPIPVLFSNAEASLDRVVLDWDRGENTSGGG